jgi:hypothetical protein
MTAKAALAKALLDGRVLNVKNCFDTIGLTNCSREISRMIEKPFGVTVSRTHREGRSRYGQAVVWVDYRLNRTPYNSEGIQKMIEYVSEQVGTILIKTDKQEKSFRKAGLINTGNGDNLNKLLE